MQFKKLFVLGNPTDRCSFVWFGQPPEKYDEFYSTFSLFKEHKIEWSINNVDGTFNLKPEGIDFIYKNIKPI